MDGYLFLIIPIMILSQPVLVICQDSEIDVNICQTQNQVRALLAHINSPDFPDPVPSPRNCKCVIKSKNMNKMDIGLKYLIQDRDTVQINYLEDGELRSWKEIAFSMINNVSEELGIVIATNATYAEVLFQTKGDNAGITLFQVNIEAASIRDELSINCTNSLPSTSQDEITNTDSKEEGLLSTIDSICSPQLIIILASLCTVFLLIILAVSITLCCLVPKKKQKFLEVIRRSRIMDHEVRSTKKSKRMESRIYDEASFRNSQGLYLESGTPAQNNLLQVPQATDGRQSSHMYANTAEWQT